MHIIRRGLPILCLVFASLVTFTGTAHADYGGCHATASKSTVTAGESITITGTGARPLAMVTAAVGSTAIGSVAATTTGTFSIAAKVPTNATGTVTVSVNCGLGAGTDSLTLTIASTSGTPLARTGSDTGAMATVAISLVAAGAILLGYSRKRRLTV